MAAALGGNLSCASFRRHRSDTNLFRSQKLASTSSSFNSSPVTKLWHTSNACQQFRGMHLPFIQKADLTHTMCRQYGISQSPKHLLLSITNPSTITTPTDIHTSLSNTPIPLSSPSHLPPPNNSSPATIHHRWQQGCHRTICTISRCRQECHGHQGIQPISW